MYEGKARRDLLRRAKAQIAEKRNADMLEGMAFNTWDEAFDQLNQRFWRGNLRKIPVSTESTKQRKLGWFGHSGYIKLSSNKGMSPNEMLGVLLHEMCHHYVHETYGHGRKSGRGTRVIGHGKEWKAEMRRVGYQGKVSRYNGKERFVQRDY